MITIVVFVVSVTASSTVLGFTLGVALGWIPGPSPVAVASVLLAALVADVVSQRTGRLAPIAVGKQVPREWGRIFSAPTVAVLYGARLGIAPLTILSTWSWWAVIVLGGIGGVAWSVPVGVAFGIVRSVTSVSASLLAERSSTRSGWFTRLQTGRSVGDRSLRMATIVGVAVLALAAAGCTGAGDVDDVRLWSVGLTLNEVFLLRDQELPAGTPGLAGRWSFDDGTPTDVAGPNGEGAGFNHASPFGPISPGVF